MRYKMKNKQVLVCATLLFLSSVITDAAEQEPEGPSAAGNRVRSNSESNASYIGVASFEAPEDLYQRALGLIEENPGRARIILARAGELGHAESFYELGQMFFYGEGGEIDLAQTRDCFARAGKLGHAESLCRLGGMYCQGEEGGDPDPFEGLNSFWQASNLGHLEATNQVAQILYHGITGQRNPEMARAYAHAAAERGNTDAQTLLSAMLYNGEGGDVDLDGAVFYASAAAAKGSDDAIGFLASL